MTHAIISEEICLTTFIQRPALTLRLKKGMKAKKNENFNYKLYKTKINLRVLLL